MARRSRSDEPTLFPLPGSGPKRKGRHERQTDAAIHAARARALLGPEHAALVTTLRALARSLDHAEATEQPYAVASVARELRACLIEARMSPGPQVEGDGFAALMEALTEDGAPQ